MRTMWMRGGRFGLMAAALVFGSAASAGSPIGQPPAAATAGKADPIAQRALDNAKIKYEVDKDGDFRIVYDLEGGRTQQVWLRSATFDYGALKIREVISYGYKAPGKTDGLPLPIANRMLENNNQVKLGAWVRQGGAGIFVSKISATATSKEVSDALELTARVADKLEQEFTGEKDEF